MDKITHQVRAEHWAKIMNECLNSGMPKTAWCRVIIPGHFEPPVRILRAIVPENEVLPQLSVLAFKHCHAYSIIIVVLYRRLFDDGIRQ